MTRWRLLVPCTPSCSSEIVILSPPPHTQDNERRGVTVLLGHMPNAVVKVFADTEQPKVRRWQTEVYACIRGDVFELSMAGAAHNTLCLLSL